MTKILLHFLTTTGIPLSLAFCEIRLTRSDYTEALSGVLMPRLVEVQLDVDGMAHIELWPCDTRYHITVYDPMSRVALHHDFYVPVLADPNDEAAFQDLIVPTDAVLDGTAYDAAALLQILQAKVEVLAAKNAAEASAVAAAASAVLANQSIDDITNARDDAVNAAATALVSQTASANSATSAYNDSQLAGDRAAVALQAKVDAQAAATSVGNSADTAVAAAISANEAKVIAVDSATAADNAADIAIYQAGVTTAKAGEAFTSASTATTQAGIATTKAGEAAGSATTANTKAGEASASASAANTSAGNASTSASAANTSKINAGTSETNASGFATTASNAATTATTQAEIATTKAGEANTSAGNAAGAATTATTQAGIATTKAGEASTSATNANNSAVAAALSASQASQGQINSDWNTTDPGQKSYIANKPVIPSTKADVGLGNVDNTSDANKPVSTSQAAINALKAPLDSPAFTGTPTGITKAHVGLGNVDNTSDVNKPVSTAQQTALNAKAPLASPAFTGTPTGITKAHVGLGNVDNTTDAGKPVSTAQQNALDLKANLTSPMFGGTVSVGTVAGPTTAGLEVNRNLKNGVTSYGVRSNGVTQAAVTTSALMYSSVGATAAVAFNVAGLYHYHAAQGTIGAGSSVTTQAGLYVDASMVGATNNMGVHSNIPAGAGRWNIFALGTANNFFNGPVLVGSQADTGEAFQVTGTAKFNGAVAFMTAPTGLTKTHVGLANVDNISDADKQVSTAQATAIGLKQDANAKDASGGFAGLTLFKLNMRNALNTFTSFFTNANTAARTYTLPDKDGTVAMVSDIVGSAPDAVENLSNKTLLNPVVKGFVEQVVSLSGTTFTLDLSLGTVFRCATTGNATITLPASVVGKCFTVIVEFGGVHTVTFAGGTSLKWSGASVPTPTSVNTKKDIYTFFQDGSVTYCRDGGRNF